MIQFSRFTFISLKIISQARVVSMCAYQMKNSTLEANFWLLLDAGLRVTTGSKQTINLEE